MTRTVLLSPIALLALSACITPDANPLSWSANYQRPFEPLTMCIAQNTPADYSVVPAIDQRQKIGGVLLSSRSNGQKAGEFAIYRIDDGSSRVVFRSAIKTVGGSSYIIDQAQQVANSCGS